MRCRSCRGSAPGASVKIVLHPYLPFTSFKKCPPTVVFHRWAGILRFIVRAPQKRSEDSGLGYQPEEHYRKFAVCKIQRKDKPSVLCFKRQLRLCAVRGNAHKLFAFQQSGGSLLGQPVMVPSSSTPNSRTPPFVFASATALFTASSFRCR